MRYIKIWRKLSALAIGSYLSNRIDASSYLIGKLIRFFAFVLFIVTIFNFSDTMVGYGKYEVLLFFLTFNLVDVLPQAFFRGIYLFRQQVIKGDFDYALARPVNPLFYTLTQLTDILDIIFLLPIVSLIIYTIGKLGIIVTLGGVLTYIIFVIISQLIIIAIHILSACVTIWTLESENIIWFYRESMTIGRFPPEVYGKAIQFVFTFIMPVIMVVAFPVKALLGDLNLWWVAVFLFYSILFFIISILFWNMSLKKYSSASN